MRKRWWLAALPLACLTAGCGNADTDKVISISDADRAYGEEARPQLLAEFGGAYDGDEGQYAMAAGLRQGDSAS
ncbi:MAG: hypothetical protein EOP60_19280 [Sphingomonadales bacterium]|nr:MAG: hypothetical protein EOP60_19280 [Sphingomonadales bacterium]